MFTLPGSLEPNKQEVQFGIVGWSWFAGVLVAIYGSLAIGLAVIGKAVQS